MNKTLTELAALFESNKKQIVDDYLTFLRFKSISAEEENRGEVLKCAKWLKDYLAEAGLTVSEWQTPGYPVIFAEWTGAGKDKPTVLIYGHYDVQPVDPIELWDSPPFEPKLDGNTVYARGAQDNKGQCFYFSAAVCALLKKNGSLPVNVKLCIEGEEEIGSPGLAKILSSRANELQADHLLIVDVGIHDRTTPSVNLGTRGLVAITVEITGSNTDLHSGSHGGIVYNPNHAMVELLASLRDDNGKITVRGFYDDVVPIAEETKKTLNFDFNPEWYEKTFNAKPLGGEKNLSPIESGWLRPTLEINGVRGGYAGDGFKTVIPAKSIAKISARLVPNQDPAKIGELIKTHLLENCPSAVSISVTVHQGMGQPIRTSPTCQVVKAAAQAFSEVLDKPCNFILDGASIPIVTELAKTSNSEVVLIGYGLPGDQIHAPNEHFDLERFKNGFVTIGRILEILAA